MKRRLLETVVLSFVTFSAAWAPAANATPPNKDGNSAATAVPQPPPPRTNSGPTVLPAQPRKAAPVKPMPTPSNVGASPSGRQASSSGTTTPPSTGRSQYSYGNYGYPGYYNGYGGYPYGTTPYGLGYNSDGSTYLYPLTPGYGSNYGYGGYSPYSYYPPPSSYYYPPLVFGDASRLFGLRPLQQMLGVDPWFNPNNGNADGGNANGNPNGNPSRGNNGQANAQGNRPGRDDAANGDDAESKKAARPPNGRASALVWKFITYGDASFQKKKYNAALDSYRTAVRQTAVVADAWLRQGFAQAALGKYDLAAKAFRHGQEINPNWASTDFHLSELYGNDDTEKSARLQAMTLAAQREPNNADLAFVLGVHLYFDGQNAKAVPFLRRAAQLSGNDGDVKSFLADK